MSLSHSPDLPLVTLKSAQSFAVISDVHLRDPNDALTRLFIETLKSLRDIDAVFFLGDIFDFIFIGHRYFVERWQCVFDALRDLKDRDVELVFVEGNHDFGFEHYRQNLPPVFARVGDFQVHLTHTKIGDVILRHGDDIICPPNYRPFRRFVKSAQFQKLAGLVPAKAMNTLCHMWASQSRERSGYTLERDVIEKHLRSHFEFRTRPNLLVLGHIHTYTDFYVEGTRVVIGPDWPTAPSILLCDEDGIVRREFFTEKRPSVSILEPSE